LEEILTHNFLGTEAALKLFLFAHWRWWWSPVESTGLSLHIKVAVWANFKE